LGQVGQNVVKLHLKITLNSFSFILVLQLLVNTYEWQSLSTLT